MDAETSTEAQPEAKKQKSPEKDEIGAATESPAPVVVVAEEKEAAVNEKGEENAEPVPVPETA